MRKLTPYLLFTDSYKKYSDKTMLIHNGKEMSYWEVKDKVDEISDRIQTVAFRMGGIYLPNGMDFILWMLAFNKEKKIVLPISYQLKDESFVELVNFSDAEVIVTDERGYEEIKKYKDRINLKGVFVLGINHDHCVYKEINLEAAKSTSLRADTFCICFTSGSTAKPKGIVLSNQAICGNALSVADYIRFEPGERTILPRSMAQASPISGDILMSISRGGSIIILNDLFYPAIFLKAIQKYNATNVFMIRTMLSQVLDYPNLKSFQVPSMKRILLGGMLNPKHIFIEGCKAFPHIDFYNAYGLSEVSARAAFLSPEYMDRKLGAIGKPIRGCKLQIIKQDGCIGNPGEMGEIYVKSNYVMDGYYKDPELTKATLISGWLRSRDRGYRDHENFFYVIGRVDDLIIQGGTKVYPIEIEEALLRNRCISEAVVMGIKDKTLGQRIVVFVKAHTGSSITVREVYRWLRIYIEETKLPKEVYIVEKIPRNAVGKISNAQVHTMYENLKKERIVV